MSEQTEPEPLQDDDATPPPGNVITSAADSDEAYVVDLIESVRRDRAVLNRAKRMGFLRASG
jgi:hypothetical protein